MKGVHACDSREGGESGAGIREGLEERGTERNLTAEGPLWLECAAGEGEPRRRQEGRRRD